MISRYCSPICPSCPIYNENATIATTAIPDIPSVEMCFVSTFVDSTARSQNLVLLNIHVVKCEYDEICSPAKDSEYYGMGLGYVFSFKLFRHSVSQLYLSTMN